MVLTLILLLLVYIIIRIHHGVVWLLVSVACEVVHPALVTEVFQDAIDGRTLLKHSLH